MIKLLYFHIGYLLFAISSLSTASDSIIDFSKSEHLAILSHGPWPVQYPTDTSNHLSGNQRAIEFGKALFFDESLSATKNLSCATCHQPKRYFSDGLPLSISNQQGVSLDRNTPSLLNLAFNRWFGWGGESDSLWSHSIRPLVDEREMATTPKQLKTTIQANHSQTYTEIFETTLEEHNAEQVLVNIAKALAAYQETLISPPTAFDNFREALANHDVNAMAKYPVSAQRGLRIFMDKGRCAVCHFGATFSNGEFADIGIPFFVEGGVDSGRYKGIQTVKNSAFNRLGTYSDTQASAQRWWTERVYLQHKNFGEFKVPSLRNSEFTAPYMHNGSLATLEDVIQHYNHIDEERLHADGETILQPLDLSKQEQEDLLAFLKSLSSVPNTGR